jgi:hypothetical protein
MGFQRYLGLEDPRPIGRPPAADQRRSQRRPDNSDQRISRLRGGAHPYDGDGAGRRLFLGGEPGERALRDESFNR